MKMLVCADGSAQSQKAIDKALEIAGGCSVDEITLISVVEEKYKLPSGSHDRMPLTPEEVRKFEKLGEYEQEEAEKMLEAAAKRFADKGIKAGRYVACGHPAETISSYAAEGGFDMIVMGSRGLGGLRKLLLGSVSSAVLQEAPCSVLVVK